MFSLFLISFDFSFVLHARFNKNTLHKKRKRMCSTKLIKFSLYIWLFCIVNKYNIILFDSLQKMDFAKNGKLIVQISGLKHYIYISIYNLNLHIFVFILNKLT